MPQIIFCLSKVKTAKNTFRGGGQYFYLASWGSKKVWKIREIFFILVCLLRWDVLWIPSPRLTPSPGPSTIARFDIFQKHAFSYIFIFGSKKENHYNTFLVFLENCFTLRIFSNFLLFTDFVLVFLIFFIKYSFTCFMIVCEKNVYAKNVMQGKLIACWVYFVYIMKPVLSGRNL